MSTTYTLLPVGGDRNSPSSLDITEQSMKYDLAMQAEPKAFEYGANFVEFEDLTPEEVIAVAVRMLEVVLYQYPELHTEIARMVDELMPGAERMAKRAERR